MIWLPLYVSKMATGNTLLLRGLFLFVVFFDASAFITMPIFQIGPTKARSKCFIYHRFITRLRESKKANRREETRYLEKRKPTTFVEGLLESIVPPIVPVLAFLYYDEIVKKFQLGVKYVSRNTWLNDGSKDPTIYSALNSIVIPTSAILYATLTATTINVLRQRQQRIREGLNQEASELRTLQGLLEFLPDDRQDRFRLYLIRYISRAIDECQPRINLKGLESRGVESEITDLLGEMNNMVDKDKKEERTDDILIFQAYDALTRLKQARANRLSSLQDRLPILHYVVLFSLPFSITVGFLIETNKAKVDFDAFQLRILWAQLVASFSALAIVCYDLNIAFEGNYQVKRATDQLFTIRFSLQRGIPSIEGAFGQWVPEAAPIVYIA